jgi:hypothetical protein
VALGTGHTTLTLAFFAAVLLLTGCGSSESDETSNVEAPRSGTPITVESIDGHLEQAFVVAPNEVIPVAKLAAAVRETGYPCEAVTGMGQIEQDGQVLDIYKVDCSSTSYQVTVFPGGSRIKPWTGKIFGR